jgi:hypothetical protein
MFELIFAFLMGLACPGNTTTTHTNCHNDNPTVTIQGELPPDTGGEGGHFPPKNP